MQCWVKKKKNVSRSRSQSGEENNVQNGHCDIMGPMNVIKWGENQDEGIGTLVGERRRRKLPEIPVNKKRESFSRKIN